MHPVCFVAWVRAVYALGCDLKRSIIPFACACLASSQVFAANVANVQGQTLLNVGSGYHQLVGSSPAGPGAQVLANPGGEARVTYEDGCTVTVSAGQVYTVAPASPCTENKFPQIGGYAIGAAVVGGVAAVVIVAAGGNKSASP